LPVAASSERVGHSDPKFTLRVYTHLMSRRDGERERLKALVEGAEWAALGGESDSGGSMPTTPAEEGPAICISKRDQGDGRYWARTSDLQLVELALSQLS
jgi:hypothetical protein